MDSTWTFLWRILNQIMSVPNFISFLPKICILRKKNRSLCWSCHGYGNKNCYSGETRTWGALPKIAWFPVEIEYASTAGSYMIRGTLSLTYFFQACMRTNKREGNERRQGQRVRKWTSQDLKLSPAPAVHWRYLMVTATTIDLFIYKWLFFIQWIERSMTFANTLWDADKIKIYSFLARVSFFPKSPTPTFVWWLQWSSMVSAAFLQTHVHVVSFLALPARPTSYHGYKLPGFKTYVQCPSILHWDSFTFWIGSGESFGRVRGCVFRGILCKKKKEREERKNESYAYNKHRVMWGYFLKTTLLDLLGHCKTTKPRHNCFKGWKGVPLSLPCLCPALPCLSQPKSCCKWVGRKNEGEGADSWTIITVFTNWHIIHGCKMEHLESLS